MVNEFENQHPMMCGKIRADERTKVIDEVKMYAYRNIHFFNAIEQKGFYEYLEQLRGGVENGRD